MKLGCSYFGNRILKHVKTDMQELVNLGCTYVVHTFNENDWMFYHKTIGDIVKISHDAGLEVYIDPWGVAKIFGGESFSNFVMQNVDAMQIVSDGWATGAACPNNPKLRQFLREWTDAACETGADILFWDEPHFYLAHWLGGRPGTWGCCCDCCRKKFQETRNQQFPQDETDELKLFKEDCIMELLTELVEYGASKGKKNALCVLPPRKEHGATTIECLAAIPKLDVFGTDPYWFAFKEDMNSFVGGSSKLVKELCDKYGMEAQMWLQGFKIPAGGEQELVAAVDLMAECGIRNIAVWGYECCGNMSWIKPDNPELCWQKVAEAYAMVKTVR